MLRRRLALAAGTVLALLGTGSALPGAAQASGHKTYTLAVTPCVVEGAGIFEATLTNTAADQRLGSANITLPVGLFKTVTESDPKVELRNGVLEVRNIDLRPAQSYTVKAQVQTELAPRFGTTSADARQSNDFKGVGNEFTLDRSRSHLNTKVITSGEPCELGQDTVITCSDGQSKTMCALTRRHYVPCGYVKKLNGAANCGQSAAFGTQGADLAVDVFDANHYVDTTVQAAPDVLLNDGGTLELFYETKQDKNKTDNDATDAGCTGYAEPSNWAARFKAPQNRDLDVTYIVSAALWTASVASGNSDPQPSCFSAPYFFGSATEVPFLFEEKPWFNSKLPGCPSGDSAFPCQRSAAPTADGGRQTVDFVPWSPGELLDPMKY